MKIRLWIYGVMALVVTMLALGTPWSTSVHGDPFIDDVTKALGEYASRHAHDPDSVEIVHVTPRRIPVTPENAGTFDIDGMEYMVRWRGRNAFGALVLREDMLSFFPDTNSVELLSRPAFMTGH